MNQIVTFYATWLPGKPAVRLVEVDATPRSTGEYVTVVDGSKKFRVSLRGRRNVSGGSLGKAYYEFRAA